MMCIYIYIHLRICMICACNYVECNIVRERKRHILNIIIRNLFGNMLNLYKALSVTNKKISIKGPDNPTCQLLPKDCERKVKVQAGKVRKKRNGD